MKRLNFVFALLFVSNFLIVAVAKSDSPFAPILIDKKQEGCVPTTELCGDGVDQDCNGSDALCSGLDKDRDGFSTNDCDDSNRQIYPGVSVSCASSCGYGVKTCQDNGSYTICSCSPVCEATGTGKCYYISALTGSDSNAGTFNSPWKTYLNIVSYYAEGDYPAGWVELKAGDFVYFMSGRYSSIYTYNTTKTGLFFRGRKGTAASPITLKAYPGSRPVIAHSDTVLSSSSTSLPKHGIGLYQTSYITIDGFEIRNAQQQGIGVDESVGIVIKNNIVHETWGSAADNIAGIYIVATETGDIHHNILYDNFDRSQRNWNSRNMVLFGGGNIRVHHNSIFFSEDVGSVSQGGCIVYKHSAKVEGQIFEADHNILRNCGMDSIASGSFGTRIHHNLLVNSIRMVLGDQGGEAHMRDMIVENNTITGSYALEYGPTIDYGGSSDLGLMTYRKNIVIDTSGYSSERSMVRISEYGSDSLYALVTGGNYLAINYNCYYNQYYPLQFSLFGSKTKSALGSYPTFSEWQGLGYDTNSYNVNPELDSSYAPSNTLCSDKGWLAD